MDSRSLPQKWKLLFNSLLQSSYPHAEFEIETDVDNIIFSTPHEKIAKSFINTLNSPEAARASLNYTITEQKSVALTALEKKFYPEAIKLEKGTGTQVFEKVFGHATIARVGKMPWSIESLAVKRHVIFFNCETALSKLLRHQVDTFQDFLSSATLEDLRTAIAIDDTAYAPIKLKTDRKGILASHVDKILVVREIQNVVTIYFDYGVLSQFLTAPEMAIHEIKDKLFQIRINQNHLMCYLRNIFQEGFILHVSGEAPLQEALPICFNTQGSVPVNNIVSLILDVSGSMKNVFDTYIKHVINFIEKLAAKESFANARLRIVPFNHSSSVTEFFISDQENNLNLIRDHLKTLAANGSTHIYEALHTELAQLSIYSATNNITVLTFTDGQDIQPESGKHDSLKKLRKVLDEMRTSSHPATFFALGLGTVDEAQLKTIAKISHGEYISLRTIDDFTHIVRYLDKMGQARLLARFVQNLSSLSFTVPVYANDISVGSQALRFPLEFQVGDKDYDVKAGGLPLLENDDCKSPQSDLISADELQQLQASIIQSQQLLAAKQRLFAAKATRAVTLVAENQATNRPG